jgi:hypothetical protein
MSTLPCAGKANRPENNSLTTTAMSFILTPLLIEEARSTAEGTIHPPRISVLRAAIRRRRVAGSQNVATACLSLPLTK